LSDKKKRVFQKRCDSTFFAQKGRGVHWKRKGRNLKTGKGRAAKACNEKTLITPGGLKRASSQKKFPSSELNGFPLSKKMGG